MATQNLIVPQPEPQNTSDDQIPQSHFQYIHRNLINKTQNIPILKKLNALEIKTSTTSQNITHKKLINKKMRLKLINWIQKLSTETFQFSAQTLLLTIKILDKYISLTNESPSQLQLIGCAALYLAAKTSEPVIVAGQCYVIASANCFSEQQLIEKELKIYKTLNFNTTFCLMNKVYKTLRINQLTSKYMANLQIETQNLFVEIAKNLDFLKWKSNQIVSMMIVFCEVYRKLPTVSQLHEKLQSYCGC